MATDLQDRAAPEGDQELNPGQAHYDREFSTMAENYSQDADPASEDANIQRLRDSENSPDAARESLFNSTGDMGTGAKAIASAGLNAAMAPVSAAAFPVALAKGARQVFNVVRNNKKKAGIAGGATGIVVGTVLTAVVLLAPLKIESIVTKLTQRYMAASNSAVESETQTLFEHYIATRVLPGYKRCGTTISKNCAAVKSSLKNPVSQLYNSWSDARLENRLASKYGIEFQKKPDGWYLKSPSGTTNIGNDGEKLDQGLQKVGRSDMRAAIKSETRWYQVMTRYKVGRLLESKYGVKRCMFFCGSRDKLAEDVAAQKTAAKLALTQRILVPRTKTLGIALSCILDTQCEPIGSTPDVDPNAPSENGAPGNAEIDAGVSDSLRAYAATYGAFDEATLKDLEKTIADIEEKGLQKVIITEMLTRAGVTAGTAGSAADAVPVVGWINLGVNLYDGIDKIGPKLQKLSYVVNTASAVQLFSTYQTYADEIHTGKVTGTEIGAMVATLDSNPSKTAGADPRLGGTASAEATPLYQNLMGTGSPSSQSSLADVFMPPTFAATTTSDKQLKYTCQDNKTPSAAAKICTEDSYGSGNEVVNSVNHFMDHNPFMFGFKSFAFLWKHSVGYIFDGINWLAGGLVSGALKAADLACATPGLAWTPPVASYCAAKDAAAKFAPYIQQLVADWLIPSNVGSNMSGGKVFVQMAGGADALGSDFAHYGIGGHLLSPQQSAEIVNSQLGQERKQFSEQPFFARMFSTDTPYSFISRVALAMPSQTPSSFENTIATIFFSPLHLISSMVSFTSPGTSADTTAQADLFNVPPYGYTQADLNAMHKEIAKFGGYETYWTANCVDDASQGYQKDNAYNQEAADTINPANQMPMNTSTNPCALIKTTVGSAGGAFNKDLLTQDDLSIGSTGGSSAP